MPSGRNGNLHRIFAALIVIAICTGSPVHALDNVATTAAQFLKIDVGARASALGGNFVALSNDPSALFWNPAGITQLRGPSFTASHIEWFADIVHDFAGYAQPVGDGALGISVIALNIGKFEQTTEAKPEGTGIFVDFSSIAIGATYARQMTDFFSFGITGKYVAEKVFNESAQTIAVDLGTLLDVGYKSIRIGMSMTNFGGRMKLSGRDLLLGIDTNYDSESDADASLSTNSWSLPLRFRVGMAMDVIGRDGVMTGYENHRLTLTVDGLHPNDNVETIGFGLEYGWSETIYLRSGYKGNHDSEDVTFGGGILIPISGVDLGIDYSYSDMGDLEDVQRAAITLLF